LRIPSAISSTEAEVLKQYLPPCIWPGTGVWKVAVGYHHWWCKWDTRLSLLHLSGYKNVYGQLRIKPKSHLPEHS